MAKVCTLVVLLHGVMFGAAVRDMDKQAMVMKAAETQATSDAVESNSTRTTVFGVAIFPFKGWNLGGLVNKAARYQFEKGIQASAIAAAGKSSSLTKTCKIELTEVCAFGPKDELCQRIINPLNIDDDLTGGLEAYEALCIDVTCTKFIGTADSEGPFQVMQQTMSEALLENLPAGMPFTIKPCGDCKSGATEANEQAVLAVFNIEETPTPVEPSPASATPEDQPAGPTTYGVAVFPVKGWNAAGLANQAARFQLETSIQASAMEAARKSGGLFKTCRIHLTELCAFGPKDDTCTEFIEPLNIDDDLTGGLEAYEALCIEVRCSQLIGTADSQTPFQELQSTMSEALLNNLPGGMPLFTIKKCDQCNTEDAQANEKAVARSFQSSTNDW